MPRLYTCPTCGRIAAQPYCPEHAPAPKGRRDLNQHKRWARRIIHRDGGRCRVCGSTEDVRACHIQPFASFLNPADAWALDNGITLCGTHDRATDPQAGSPRVRRANQRTQSEQGPDRREPPEMA